MFSYFNGGLNNITPKEVIDLQDLVRIIMNNPQKALIEEIRARRQNGDTSYKELKRTLPYITPNCQVKERKLGGCNEYNDNFIGASKFIYFDIDDINIGELDNFKATLIQKYSNIISLMCKSSSLGGLSILVRISKQIKTKGNCLGTLSFQPDKSLDTKLRESLNL